MPSPRDKAGAAQALEKNGINAAFSSAQAATLQARLTGPPILRLPRNAEIEQPQPSAEPERLRFKQIRSRPGKRDAACVTRLRDPPARSGNLRALAGGTRQPPSEANREDEEAPAFCFQTATDDLKVKATYPIWPTGWPTCWLPARRPEFVDRSTAPRLISKVTKYRRVTRNGGL